MPDFFPRVFPLAICAAACATSSLATPAPLYAQEPARRSAYVGTAANGQGQINYSAGVVRATGSGATKVKSNSPAQARLMALGAAKADALRNLAMTVSSIQVTATTKVKNYEMQSDLVETNLRTMLMAARVVSESYAADGTATVIVEMPMYGPGSVASVVFPEVLPAPDISVPLAPAAPGTFAPGGGAGANANGDFVGPATPAIRVSPTLPAPIPPLPRGREPGLTPITDNGPFSALIVDCRGLGIEAIMSPKLMDTTGREVYGTIRVTPEYAIETGIVGYPRSMAEAIQSARSGSHPLIVRALRAGDKFRFNPVISLEDADRILAVNNRDKFLEQTRVIFLVDPVK